MKTYEYFDPKREGDIVERMVWIAADDIEEADQHAADEGLVGSPGAQPGFDGREVYDAVATARRLQESNWGGIDVVIHKRQYVNHYECKCGAWWTDRWTCACDDDCPECGTTCGVSDFERDFQIEYPPPPDPDLRALAEALRDTKIPASSPRADGLGWVQVKEEPLDALLSAILRHQP